ncbi:MAG: glycosyltransferase family 4 protein [Fimbriiglobus sp.]
MRIVHLTASSFFGGPERQMLGLAQALPAEFACQFLLFSEGGKYAEFQAQIRAAGFPAECLTADAPHFLATLRALTAKLRDAHAQVLITHGYKSNILGRIAARRTGIPIVSVSRGWTWENRKMQLYTWLDQRHLKFIDHVVAVSDGQRDKVLACGVPPQRVTTIRNSSRLASFTQRDPSGERQLRSYLPASVERIVLAAGRLSPEKGFDVLLRAAQEVLEADSGTGFVLFGEGDERAALTALANELNLGERFVMPGFTKELDTLIPWADVVVLSSYSEGLPNVLLEASAAGVPIVATRVGGVPEVVEEGDSGFLVEAGHHEDLARRLIQLLWDADRRRVMGEAGRERMQAMFTFEAQAQSYMRLLEQIVPTSRSQNYAAAA